MHTLPFWVQPDEGMNRYGPERMVGPAYCHFYMKNQVRHFTRLCGFTWIELLVVIAILDGMLLPAFSKPKVSENAVKYKDNLKQMGIATYLHVHDNEDRLPFACGIRHDAKINNFQALLVPYIMRDRFIAGSDTEGSDFAKNVFICPTRMKENHWRDYKNYRGSGNPW